MCSLHSTSLRGSLMGVSALALVLLGIFVSLPAENASAVVTVPTKMNFQGRLTDTAGNIKANGNYNMKLRLYDASTGGTLKFSEDRLVSASTHVPVSNGLFSIRLNEGSNKTGTFDSSIFASGALYLEVELSTPASATSASPVWTEGAMTPRNQLATAAYAFNSETLDGQDGDYYLNAANLTGTVNSARVSGNYTGITGTGALTSGSIASGFGTISTGNTIQGTQLISTVTTGTAPLTVSSTTKVTNLNADLLDGLDSSAFAAASGSSNYIQNTTSSQTANFNITGNGAIGGSLSVGGNILLTMPSNNPERGAFNPIWTALGASRPLYTDEEFAVGTNNVFVYNNSGGSAVTITRQTGQVGVPNSTGNWLRVSYDGVGATEPNFGGVILAINPSANKTFAQRFRAKVPVGKTLNINENSQGTNYTSYWLTNNVGTGKWEDYIRVSHSGNTGTFSGGGHISISGGSGAFDWYIASMNVYEVGSSIVNAANTWSAVQTFNASGTGLSVTNNATVGGTLTVSQLVSSVATGTAPLTVSSTTKVNNLNVDTLDGYDSTSFAYRITTDDNITDRMDSGFYQTSSATIAEGFPQDTNSWYHLLSNTHSNGANYYAMQFAGNYYNSNDIFYRSTNGSGTTAWNRIWHQNNDGSGSGMDADTLDGLSSGSFAAASGNGNYVQNTTSPQSANFNITGNGTIGGALSVGSTGTFTGQVSASGLRVNSSFTDNTNNAPWYGVGQSNVYVGGEASGTATQFAGYFGVLLQSGSGQAVLTRNGNFGIGTTTPNTTARLTVMGAANTGTAAGNASVLLDNAAGSSQNVLAVAVAGTNRATMRADSSGNFVMNATGTGALYLNNDSGTGGIIAGSTANPNNFTTYGELILKNTSNANMFRIDTSGNVRAFGTVTGGVGSPDYAENIGVTDRSIQAADVVAMDPNKPEWAIKASTPYSPKMLGVISTNPGFLTNASSVDEASFADQRPLALSGRVPVKVTTQNGLIRQGDYLTSSTIPGVAMKATEPGAVLGVAMADFTGSGDTYVCGDGATCGSVLLFINPSATNPAATLNTVFQGGSAQLSALTVSGAMTASELNVNNASIANLTVTNSLAVYGTLTVVDKLETKTLVVSSHLITKGENVTAEKGSGLGEDSSVAVNGTDMAGTITITTGDKPLTAGDLAKILPKTPYENATVMLTAANGEAAGIRTSVTKLQEGFVVRSSNVLEKGKTYKFSYVIVDVIAAQ